MTSILTLPRPVFMTTLVVLGVLYCTPCSWAAPQLILGWADNSTTESGFRIERKPSTTGTYAQIAEPGPNTTSYTDTAVVVGATYCYRVRSWNSGGNSPYSNEVCGSVRPDTTLVSLSVSLMGQGAVSSPAGISCAPTCSKGFVPGSTVDLTAVPQKGWQFQGWSGSCTGQKTTCSVTLDQGKNVTASFILSNVPPPSRSVIGMFREGYWWIDNGNWWREFCGTDTCAAFGDYRDKPVLGYWKPSSLKQVGVFRSGVWYLDNGNGAFDGCTGGDVCVSFGTSADRPVVADLNGDRISEIGIYNSGFWQFDNGNRHLDNCAIDTCIHGFGTATDIPIVGDWNGDGRDDIGVFNAGSWYLDGGNRYWDGCGINGDVCVSNFGQFGDTPVVGDWNGDGKTDIGIFRVGEWHLDTGDRVWGACSSDICLSNYGTANDIPVSR